MTAGAMLTHLTKPFDTSGKSGARHHHRGACDRWGPCQTPSKPAQSSFTSLEEFAEERRCFIRDAGDLVRCLTIEFEIELGPRLAVIPVGEMFELAPPQRPLRQRGASDGDAYSRCLPGDAALFRDRFGGRDDAACDQALPALVLLAREHENRVAFGNMLAAVHRLLRGEREGLRPRIANLGLDRECRAARSPVRCWHQPDFA